MSTFSAADEQKRKSPDETTDESRKFDINEFFDMAENALPNMVCTHLHLIATVTIRGRLCKTLDHFFFCLLLLTL